MITAALLLAITYNPLEVHQGFVTKVSVIHDAPRKRDIPVRFYLPKATGKSPVILYSHGLGGTRDASQFMGEHWARRGYACVFMQHPGSDDSVWRNERLGNRMGSMNKAANAENFKLRAEDVVAVINQLEKWSAAKGHLLYGRLDLGHLGMCGHSFGAVTTQAVSGQSLGPLGPRLTDKRIVAAIPFSPSTPSVGSPERAFASVRIPWMLMTGTEDVAPIGGMTVADRLNVYPHLPKSIDRYELILDQAEHSVFSGTKLPFDKHKTNPKHHQAILALSTAFWDTHLKRSPEARSWLHGSGARMVLEPKDGWKCAAGS